MACKYCNSDYYTEKVLIRNYFADDLCDIIRENDCKDCGGCSEDKNYFEVDYYGNTFSITHWRELIHSEGGSVVISAQNSERIHRNYCHNCGKKIIT